MKNKFSLRTITLTSSAAVLVAGSAFFFITRDSAEIPAPSQTDDWRTQLTAENRLAANAGDPARLSVNSEENIRDESDALLSPMTSVAEQRRRAFLLAEEDPQKARELLEQLMASGEHPALQAALAEALALSENSDIKTFIDSLATGENEELARAAIRGISGRDSAEAAGLLSNILHNPGMPDSMRTEAARSLGQMQEPTAFNHLLRASYEVVDLDDFEPVFHSVLEGMGMADYTQTADYFARLLEHPDIDIASKVTALEALADAQGDAAKLLLQYVSHEDMDMREAAIWSLAVRPEIDQYAEPVMSHILREKDPDARALLYSTAAAAGANAEALWQNVMDESDRHAYLAGLSFLATQAQGPLGQRFDREAVPNLKKIAQESTHRAEQIKAINALGRANTAGARAALLDINASNSDPRVQQAITVAQGH